MSVGAQSRPVDIAHLSRYTGGDVGVNVEVLTLFADQMVELLGRLETALARHDGKSWRDVTHGLKGGARGVGAFALADAAAAAEAFDPASGGAAGSLQQLKLQAETVAEFIDAYLGR
jgi:HPt (histidine-containing phosphotransfer) domain-containing protein